MKQLMKERVNEIMKERVDGKWVEMDDARVEVVKRESIQNSKKEDITCPFCKNDVKAGTVTCPHCKNDLSFVNNPLGSMFMYVAIMFFLPLFGILFWKFITFAYRFWEDTLGFGIFG